MTETPKIKRGDANTVQTRKIILLKPGHKAIRKLKKEHEPSIHGTKVWNSSFLIMDYLKRQPLPKTTRMLDIGCGWGPLSIYAAKRLHWHVTAVDADKDVFPYLQLHARINQVNIHTNVARFEKLTRKKLGQFDLMAGADICFWDELTPVLFNLVNRAVKAGVKQIVIADPGRSPFYALAERCEKKFDARVIERNTSTPKTLSADLLIITND